MMLITYILNDDGTIEGLACRPITIRKASCKDEKQPEPKEQEFGPYADNIAQDLELFYPTWN